MMTVLASSSEAPHSAKVSVQWLAETKSDDLEMP